MLKKLLVVLLVACSFGCHKNQQQSACGTGQVCTTIYASVIIIFHDKDGQLLSVNDFSAINQRTHLALDIKSNSPYATGIYGSRTVASDDMRDQFSTEGDDILITATNPATKQTKSIVLKISGGCNCHVENLSGVYTLTFD
ncbi:MAG: hypothetical protein V4560_11820 [Bacteroidota bacterium]